MCHLNKETGRGLPDIEMLKKISDEFNVSIEDLISGKEQTKKPNHTKLLSIIILFLLGLCAYICFHNQNNLDFIPISSSKDNFSVTGVLAKDNNKIIIYISNISSNEQDYEKNYLAIESILYEEKESNQKILSKYGDIETSFNTIPYNIVELLQNIAFNVAETTDNCPSLTNHNLFITINLLRTDGIVIAHKIPLKLIDNCSK